MLLVAEIETVVADGETVVDLMLVVLAAVALVVVVCAGAAEPSKMSF